MAPNGLFQLGSCESSKLFSAFTPPLMPMLHAEGFFCDFFHPDLHFRSIKTFRNFLQQINGQERIQK